MRLQQLAVLGSPLDEFHCLQDGPFENLGAKAPLLHTVFALIRL